MVALSKHKHFAEAKFIVVFFAAFFAFAIGIYTVGIMYLSMVHKHQTNIKNTFYWAVADANLSKIKYLDSKHHNKEALDESLIIAVKRCNPKTVKLLLELGADPNAIDNVICPVGETNLSQIRTAKYIAYQNLLYSTYCMQIYKPKNYKFRTLIQYRQMQISCQEIVNLLN